MLHRILHRLIEVLVDVAANDGQPMQEKTDTLDVDLIAHPGYYFKAIESPFFGDYTITDAGAPGGNSVTAHFDLSASAAGIYSPPSPWHSDEPAFTATSGSGSWYVDWGLNDLGSVVPYVTSLHLHIDGISSAFSDGEGGSASMTQSFTLGFRIITSPEPTMLSLVGAGGLLLARRRPRR